MGVTASPELPADPAFAGFMLDSTVKGIPPHVALPLAGAGAQGRNLLRGDLLVVCCAEAVI